MTTTTDDLRQLYFPDLLRLSGTGLSTRKLRAALSALGIAIGVVDALGTNLLTAGNGQALFGQEAELPVQSPATARHLTGSPRSSTRAR